MNSSAFNVMAAGSLALPPESQPAVLQRDQTLVRNSYPMGIARQVLQHLSRSAERRFGINYPFSLGNPG
jgi:hypothetical protein